MSNWLVNFDTQELYKTGWGHFPPERMYFLMHSVAFRLGDAPDSGGASTVVASKGSGPRDRACGNVRRLGFGVVCQYLDHPAALFNASEYWVHIVHLCGSEHEKATEFCVILNELQRKPLFLRRHFRALHSRSRGGGGEGDPVQVKIAKQISGVLKSQAKTVFIYQLHHPVFPLGALVLSVVTKATLLKTVGGIKKTAPEAKGLIK